MTARAILLVALLFPRMALSDDTANAKSATSVSRALQDPETKVVYYLESDMAHIVAISPKGTLLWFRGATSNIREALVPGKQNESLVLFTFMGSPRNQNEACIYLRTKQGGVGTSVWLSRKDGTIVSSSRDSDVQQ